MLYDRSFMLHLTKSLATASFRHHRNEPRYVFRSEHQNRRTENVPDSDNQFVYIGLHIKTRALANDNRKHCNRQVGQAGYAMATAIWQWRARTLLVSERIPSGSQRVALPRVEHRHARSGNPNTHSTANFSQALTSLLDGI